MAEVKLQVIVKREQVDALQKDIDKLNKTKIIINTQESNKNIQQTQKTLQQLEKTQQQQLKTEQERQKLTQQQAKTEQEALRVEKERASIIGQKAKNEREIARAEQENAKAIKEVHRAEQAQIKTERERQKATEQSANATREHGKATKEAANQESFMQKILGRTTGEFIARMTVYRAVYAGIRAVTNGFQEAIQTLRAVDDELVTVRKVTGFDQYQMADVESSAYSVASKYGANAADYVSGVASFARAGYKELSGDLEELAQKTQIVGDTTADIATQFLLSVDAAYKYKGSVTELSKVLDMANELDNKYATSIEKIAEGMGIVAPVAAQMHVGVDELAAAIGTVTAVTQRSGTEAARALRALFLNIVGDTKTEIEEGVTWTTGEIAGLKDVLNKYAPEAVKAAEATGRIIDPMEAIGGLAQSMKEGTLNEQKLMEMVSDIGGKLRTSQLLALIQNWDMYNSMLKDTANAAGSADKEIANAMDSWTRKTNVLKNTWTEFIKSSLNSGQIKFLLDALTFFIQRLDTLTLTVTRVGIALAALKLHSVAKELTGISSGLIDVEKDASRAAKAFSTMGASAKGLNIAAGIIGGIALAWSAVSFAVESYKRAQEEARQAAADAIKTTQEDIATLDELKARYESIISSTADETEKNKELAEFKKQLVDVYGFEKEAVAGVNAERQTGIDLLNKEAEASLRRTLSENRDVFSDASKIYRGTTSVTTTGGYNMSQLPVEDLARAGAVFESSFSDLNQITIAGKNLREVYENLSDVIGVLEKKQLSRNGLTKNEEYLLEELRGKYNELNGEMEKWGSIYEDNVELMARYNLMMAGVSSVTVDSKDAFDGLKRSLKEVYGADKEVWEVMNRLVNDMFPAYSSGANAAADATDELTDAVKEENVSLTANQDALEKDATAAERAAAAKKDAEAAVAKFIPALITETGELTENAKAAFAASSYLADLAAAELSARNEAANANYAALRAELAGVSEQALKAATAILAMEAAYISGENSGVDMHLYRRYSNVSGATRAAEIMRQMADLERQINAISVSSGSVAKYTSSYKPSSGSSSSSGKSSGGGSSGKSGGSSGSSSSSASAEDKKLTALKDRVSLLKSELSLMQERGDSEEAQAAKMREIMDALKKEADYLKSIKGDQITINNLTQEWWSYNNKLSELMDKEAQAAKDQAEALQKAVDAQRALNNALKDRSVRYYNAATGQWEWTANPDNVASAKKARDEAISAAGYGDNEKAWGIYYAMASMMESAKAAGGAYNANPGASIWDLPNLMRNSYTTSYGGTTNSNVYNFGGFTLSEQQAKGTTLYELARRSRNLALHSSAY